jgi:hypothetical protein
VPCGARYGPTCYRGGCSRARAWVGRRLSGSSCFWHHAVHHGTWFSGPCGGVLHGLRGLFSLDERLREGRGGAVRRSPEISGTTRTRITWMPLPDSSSRLQQDLYSEQGRGVAAGVREGMRRAASAPSSEKHSISSAARRTDVVAEVSMLAGKFPATRKAQISRLVRPLRAAGNCRTQL